MKTELLCFRNVSVEPSPWGKLSYVNFDFFKGETIGIIGLKGSGINRILQVCNTTGDLTSGEIRMENQLFQAKSVYDARNKGIFHISFKSNLIDDLTVSENFFLTRNRKNIFALVHMKSIRVETNRILEEFMLDIDGDDLVHQLSSMQCLFLELIKASLLKAKVIFLHNIIKEYERDNLEDLRMILDKIKEKGITVVFLGHNYNSLMGDMDRIYVLSEGTVSKILYKGSYTEADLFGFIMGKRPLDKTYMTQRKANENDTSLYALSDFSTNRVKHLTFSVSEGKVLGLHDYDFYSGNELSRAIIGEMPVINGEMYIQGKRLKKMDTANIVRRGVGLVSNSTNCTLFEDLSVKENVTFSMLQDTHQAKLLVNDRVVNFAYRDMSDLLIGIDGEVSLKTLTHEEVMRVQLAKFIFSKSKILIVEYPMLDSDILQAHMIHEFVKKMADLGCAVIIISSNIDYLKKTCNDIIVIKEGIQTNEVIFRDNKEVT